MRISKVYYDVTKDKNAYAISCLFGPRINRIKRIFHTCGVNLNGVAA